MDLEFLLVSVYALVDDWWREKHPQGHRGPGRPPSLCDSEVLALAIISQWPRFRSERDFWRFADAHLRPCFPNLLSHGQLNRRIRAVEPQLRALRRDLALTLADGSEVYRVLDTTLIPAIVRARACRKASSPDRPPSDGACRRRSGSTASRMGGHHATDDNAHHPEDGEARVIEVGGVEGRQQDDTGDQDKRQRTRSRPDVKPCGVSPARQPLRRP